MLKQGLISIVTPAHNAAPYISRLLDSILSQDYPRVEMTVVDDGSEDDTAAIAASFRERFEHKGYTLLVISRERGGQSAAVNDALKHASGEYLVWPDSDDFYSSPDALSSMATALRDAPETVSAVRCLPRYVDADLHEVTKGMPVPGNLEKENLFEDAFFCENGFWHLSGGYMVRMEEFDRCVQGREIACARNAGQNWQLLLPVLYRGRCLTLPRKLHTVVTHTGSHSRGGYRGYDREMSKHTDFRRVLTATLARIPGIEQDIEMYNRKIDTYYKETALLTAAKYGRIGEFGKAYATVRADRGIRLRPRYRLYRLAGRIHSPKLMSTLYNFFERYDTAKR